MILTLCTLWTLNSVPFKGINAYQALFVMVRGHISSISGNTLDLWREGPSKWANGPSLNKMYIKLTKIRGHLQKEGAIKENEGADELLFGALDQN